MKDKPPIKNVQLAFACEKSWDEMEPCQTGRQCLSCQKTVIDFTQKSQEDLQAALHKGEEVCGRFHQSQMLLAHQPASFSFRRVVAGALLTLGFTSLGNELKAQVPPPPPEFPQTVDDSKVFIGIVIEKMPEYKYGGQKGMLKFIKENLSQSPSATLEGLVVVSFLIDTTGTVKHPEVLKGLSDWADQEVVRVVKLLEFIPGMQGDRNVPVRYTIPVRFGPEDSHKKKNRRKQK